jgi:hypothetical protein
MTMGQYRGYLYAALAAAMLPCGTAYANGYLESRSWQFDTSTDKANKAIVLDIIERKKGGYYDAFQVINTYNYDYSTNTNIEKQVNCDVTASAVGNNGSNGMTANSPTVGNDASIDASTTGNSAQNSTDDAGSSQIGNDQSNQGSSLSSDVTDSSTSASTGSVSVGNSSQVLNSDQNNTGNQTASVEGSQACAFAAGASN